MVSENEQKGLVFFVCATLTIGKKESIYFPVFYLSRKVRKEQGILAENQSAVFVAAEVRGVPCKRLLPDLGF